MSQRGATHPPRERHADLSKVTTVRVFVSLAFLLAYRDWLNPAGIGRQIAELQVMLLTLAKDKTEQLYLASFPSALPNIRKGI